MKYKLFLLFLIIIGFFYRINGLNSNYPLWIDEFSTGQFAAAIVKTGSPQTSLGFVETRNLLNHYVTAFSMKMIGINEFSARFPSVIWGTLMIAGVFLVFKKIFNPRVALATALLTTFSVIEITWSRQARSYALWQFVYLFTVFYLWQIFEDIREKKFRFRNGIFFVFFLVLSLLSHLLTITLLVSGMIYGLIFARTSLIETFSKINNKKKIGFFVLVGILLVLLWQAGLGILFRQVFIERTVPLRIYNHFAYYHSFLWRQYSLISFLALLGILFSILKKEAKHLFFLVVLAVHIFMVTFLFPWNDVRYLYPVFPIFFFVYLAYFFDNFTKLWEQKSVNFQKVFFFFLIIFIIFNGYKFTVKPHLYYSPNADMREIPLVDYNLAYEKIKKEINKTNTKLVIIDTWGDRIAWYLGRNYSKAYWIRPPQLIGYQIREGEKRDNVFNFGVVTDKSDLLEIIKDNPKGFVFIDGHEIPFLPSDALSYIQENLKLDIQFSRFSIDPDPYDTWPAWLYSWGISD